jgi:succinate dehydrogenase/fumarate reductase flavoprotein subunit
MNRSQFLKGAGLALGAAAVSGLAATAEAHEVMGANDAWDDEADVIVVGSGTAGAPAAIDACDNGADVLIVEKQDWLGGCLRRCGGGIWGVDTVVQRALGITDDNADMSYQYLLACADRYADPDLIRVFSDNCGPNVDWIIEDLGGQPVDEWDFVDPEQGGYEISMHPGLNLGGTPVYYEDYGLEDIMRPRCHWFTPNPDDVDPGDRYYDNPSDGNSGFGGTGLWKPFGEAIESRGIRCSMNTCLTGLVFNEDGEVAGITADVDGEPKRFKAKKAVILATGSFVNNADMYENFIDGVYSEPSEVAMVNGGYTLYQADGAGIRAGLAAGAAPSNIFLGNNGGLKINVNAQLVGFDGEPIPRLYAGGRMVGGLFSSIYPSCGTFIGTGVCFGRIAGQHAAGLEPWC